MAFVVAVILLSTTETSFVSIFSWRSPLSFHSDRDVGGSPGAALQPQPCLSVPQHEETAVARRPPPAQKPLTSPSKTVKPLGWHKYLPNGMLEMNPDGAHPILELIKNGEDKWQKKLERASRTLEEAVVEYKRRYKRAPPKGFDDWWNYVQENNVQLPDEYDFINRDLEPFWGVSPQDLLEIQQRQEEVTDSFTIGKNLTHRTDLVKVAYENPEMLEQRNLLRGLNEILDLLKPIEHLLPPFRAIFSPHDNPNLLTDYYVKKALLDAAKEGKYIDLKQLPEAKHYGFASACPFDSPGRPVRDAPVDQFHRPPPRPGKSFIHDHLLSMDPCQNPSIFYNHAQYVAHDLGPKPQPVLAMQFAYCSTPLFHDLQTPSFISWMDDVHPRENDVEWEEKTDERLLWRGRNTGMNHDKGTRWIYSQRIRLVRITNEMNGTERVLMPPLDSDITGMGDETTRRVGEGVDVKKSLLNPAIMDISFTDRPLGCWPEAYCEYMKTLFDFKPDYNAHGKDAGNHKYLVDVDGNGWSSRFKRLITTNSLVFKATAYPEWWIDRIQPWVHYVPIQVDHSDLYDAYIFFRGGLYGEGNHDDLAKKIAYKGREWSRTFWRKEDMTAYFFRMFLEYARLMSLDREGMMYNG